MPIREMTIEAGAQLRAHIFPVRRKPTGKRGKRCNPTSEIQAKLNERNARYAVTDKLDANFTVDDLAMRLSYIMPPKDEREAQRHMTNFLRRIKRLRKKLGLAPLKYIYVTERGKRSGRIHHHIVMSGGIDRDTLESLWGKGYANTQRLQPNEDGLAGIAYYMLKPAPEGEEIVCAASRRWYASKNLISPVTRRNDYRIRAKDAKEIASENRESIEELYPGYRLLRVERANSDALFLTIFMRKVEENGRRKKRE